MGMNALPLGSRFLAHIIGTVALIWRDMLRAAAIAGGIGLVVAEIADCVVAHHFPPSILAQWVALAFAFALAYSAAATVLLIDMIGSVATTIRHLEGDAHAGLGAAEALAALEAGQFFLRHDRNQTASAAPSASTVSDGGMTRQVARTGATVPPGSPRRPIPSQQRTNGTNPLLSAPNTNTNTYTSANGTRRPITSRPRTIGEAAALARAGVSSGSYLRPVSQWPTAAELAATPQPSTPITPFAEGELVPQLPPLPVRADRLPRIEWANTEDAYQGYDDPTPKQATASAPVAVAVEELPAESPAPPAERAPDEDTLAPLTAQVSHVDEAVYTDRPDAGEVPPALGERGRVAAESQPAYTDPPLVAPAWGPQFDESAIGSDTPTIVPTLSQTSRDHVGDEPTMRAYLGEPAPPTRPRQAMATHPLSRGLPRPSGPFDVPTQGAGLWERLGQALRGQAMPSPAAPSSPSKPSSPASAPDAAKSEHSGA